MNGAAAAVVVVVAAVAATGAFGFDAFLAKFDLVGRLFEIASMLLHVNRLANLTPHRRPILTPLRGGVCW